MTKSVTYTHDTYGKATLTWFKEIFEEYYSLLSLLSILP
ncbi:lysyl-tRNA synthetase [Streptococcus sp. LQJ-218]|nr:lysyl-tRNA synthetase [Streptococcus sp. LQJ-218]